ncbi:MAG: CRISPR-associated endonuclease Cas3'', partial [Dehalococcoidia bacterium]
MYAHSPNRSGRWHLLEEHLRGTARRAFEFGDVFGGGAAAEALGRWHDLGKVHLDFQAYLAGNRPRGGDHKLAGALLVQEFGDAALLSLAIEGHHGGLPELGEFTARIKLEENVARARGALTSARAAFPGIDAPPAGEVFPAGILAGGRHAWEHFVRMVFSALVDADFLDTEQHFDSQRAAARPRVDTSMAEMLAVLLRDQERQFGHAAGGLAEARRAIFEDCLEAADRPPGVFRLTVPTGGGKTRAGLAFALKHAARYGLRRVIIAVPFISITEQTAAVYQEIFGGAGQTLVLEHHSGVQAADQDGTAERGPWARLAAENWDMPLIVTTTVQLLESLFADRPSDTRKIHNIAGSVIVLDEAQSIPSHLLGPTLDMLRGLVEHYGVTVVLSTATQPAFEVIPAFKDVEATSIVRDPGRWYRALERVEYDIRLEPQSWDTIAGWLGDERQALAIVNTKADAIAL